MRVGEQCKGRHLLTRLKAIPTPHPMERPRKPAPSAALTKRKARVQKLNTSSPTNYLEGKGERRNERKPRSKDLYVKGKGRERKGRKEEEEEEEEEEEKKRIMIIHHHNFSFFIFYSSYHKTLLIPYRLEKGTSKTHINPTNEGSLYLFNESLNRATRMHPRII